MNGAEQISKQLLFLVGRWSHELRDLRLKWGHGIVRACCGSVEHLLRVCVVTLLPVAGEVGVQACQNAGRGKSVTQMTTGELTEILAGLDRELTGAVEKGYPDVQLRGSVFGDLGRKLRRLAQIEDEFAHNRVKPEVEEQEALELLSCAETLCRSHFVAVAAAIQRDWAVGFNKYKAKPKT